MRKRGSWLVAPVICASILAGCGEGGAPATGPTPGPAAGGAPAENKSSTPAKPATPPGAGKAKAAPDPI
ncbi:hypothetical protein OJF2_20190 [Aquisphaera giovannonii]|uniref:Uncharacterized protein n=1 Tax=Aquisphaera giovannonii TaxID=406548 RepID=A0A5B9VZW5_9BACT|nr:hypothetical protein OJF2_20190 [Aquisphaera giovannonii]